MGDTPRKLAPWSRLTLPVCVLFAWAGFRLYADHERVGAWEQSSFVITGITVCIGLLIFIGVFWYANRPEREDKP